MGNVSIDLSLANIWQSWQQFKRGKKSSQELDQFSYYLENNLRKLYIDLNSGQYRHGGYKKFIATDSKRREISVASIRDRIVHRLLYEYLYEIYDKTFMYDVWSCRKDKGLLGAIERTQKFLSKYSHNFVWRTDIKKFFDNVNHKILIEILAFKITDNKATRLLREVIDSYSASGAVRERERERENKCSRWEGIPIGNLTSQIFANIYLNELDRFVKHNIKPQAYLRYGDDFIVIADNLNELLGYKKSITDFLQEKLNLEVNSKNSIIVKAKHGLRFLGVEIFPKGRRLNKRNLLKAERSLNLKNIPSYSGLVKKHCNMKKIKYFNWKILNKLEEI